METMINAVSWVEIPVIDFERAKKFYSAIFDYEMQEMTMDTSRMGFLPSDQERGVGAAIVKMDGFEPSLKGPAVYLNGGSDLNKVLNRIEAAGGKITMSKTEIGMDFGFFASFTDSEGNAMSLHSMS